MNYKEIIVCPPFDIIQLFSILNYFVIDSAYQMVQSTVDDHAVTVGSHRKYAKKYQAHFKIPPK